MFTVLQDLRWSWWKYLEDWNECTLPITNDEPSLFNVSGKLEDWNECTLATTNDVPSLYEMFLGN